MFTFRLYTTVGSVPFYALHFRLEVVVFVVHSTDQVATVLRCSILAVALLSPGALH